MKTDQQRGWYVYHVSRYKNGIPPGPIKVQNRNQLSTRVGGPVLLLYLYHPAHVWHVTIGNNVIDL